MSLVRQLPRESSFQRELDPEGSQWGLAEHLLALLWELTANVNRDPKKQSTPFEFPRPGVGEGPAGSGGQQRSHRRQGARRVSMADMASMMRG